LSPVPAGTRLGELPSLLASLPRLAQDDAAALSLEMEAARRNLEAEPPEDPWAS
jgi:hypothetical protein